MAKPQKQVTFAEELVTDLTPRIDSHLLCPSCKKRFVSPILLPCLHSICKSCLDDERVVPKNGKTARCPTCLEPLDLQRDFPVNFVLNNLANEAALATDNPQNVVRCDSCDSKDERVTMHCDECYLFLCNFCATAHRRMSATRAHHITSVQKIRSKSNNPSFVLPRPCFCAVHLKKQILYFCKTCQLAVCRECVLADHREHTLQRPGEVYKEVKSTITSMTDKIKKKRKKMQKSVSSLQEAITKIEKHSSKIRSAIEEFFETLLMAVRQRMKTLLAELKERIDGQINKLQDQKLKLEVAAKVAQNCCAFTESALSRGTDVELISVSHVIVKRLAEFQKEECPSPVIPCDQNLCFTADGVDDLIEIVSSLGELEDAFQPTDPALSTVTDTALQVTVGQVSRVGVTAFNQKGFRQTKGGDVVSAQLDFSNSSHLSGDNLGFKYNVHDNDDGLYTVAFLINKPGSYQMYVSINGHPVQGSPLGITVNPSDWIGSACILSGERYGGFSNPHCVLTVNNNNIIIADSHHHQIKILTSDGALIKNIGTQGTNEGQLNFPFCVTLNTRKNLLFVSDSHNNRIQVFDYSGNFRHSFGSYGSEDGFLNHPHGIAIDSNDTIYVADSGNSRVQIFSPVGDLLGKLESRYLSRPWGVALTQKGQIAVTDYNYHKVFVFNKDGSLSFHFGSRGSGDGELNNPAGIVVDDEGQFIVADRSNHRVQIFQPDGTFVTLFGGKGVGNGLMRFPAGVAVDDTGHLYVADTLNNRIQVFSLTAV